MQEECWTYSKKMARKLENHQRSGSCDPLTLGAKCSQCPSPRAAQTLKLHLTLPTKASYPEEWSVYGPDFWQYQFALKDICISFSTKVWLSSVQDKVGVMSKSQLNLLECVHQNIFLIMCKLSPHPPQYMSAATHLMHYVNLCYPIPILDNGNGNLFSLLCSSLVLTCDSKFNSYPISIA